MNTPDTLQRVGDEYIMGYGAEIGAGIRPMRHPKVTGLFFIDKRNDEQFERYFGVPAPYPIVHSDHARQSHQGKLDFLAAHQVVEHLDNPILTIAQWIELIRLGGVLFLSIPCATNSMEIRRQETTIEHLLEDYAFERSPTSYESRQHIYSFVSSCAALENDLMPWYAKGDVPSFARQMLYEANRVDDHDLHWHTFTASVFSATVELAFTVAGFGGETIELLDTGDALIGLYRKVSKEKSSSVLKEFCIRLRLAAARCEALL